MDNAIKTHGAAAVYAASWQAMGGKREAWEALGLPEPKSMGDYHAAMTAAFALMTPAERRADKAGAQASLRRMGRPLASAGDPTEKRSITLRRSTWERLEGMRQPRESLSACINRLLSKENTK